MTCIVGLVHKGDVYIGGDSCASNTSMRQNVTTPTKIFKVGDALFGFSNSFRAGQAIQHGLAMPDHDPRIRSIDYLVSLVVPEIRSVLDEAGALSQEEGMASMPAEFILGYRSGLYCIQADFAVLEADDDYIASGSGSLLAMGALHDLARGRVKPQERVQRALEAAAAHDPYVSPPFTILKV